MGVGVNTNLGCQDDARLGRFILLLAVEMWSTEKRKEERTRKEKDLFCEVRGCPHGREYACAISGCWNEVTATTPGRERERERERERGGHGKAFLAMSPRGVTLILGVVGVHSPQTLFLAVLFLAFIPRSSSLMKGEVKKKDELFFFFCRTLQVSRIPITPLNLYTVFCVLRQREREREREKQKERERKREREKERQRGRGRERERERAIHQSTQHRARENKHSPLHWIIHIILLYIIIIIINPIIIIIHTSKHTHMYTCVGGCENCPFNHYLLQESECCQ